MTLGPRTHTSPGAPSSTSVAPSSATSRTEMPGTSVPALPARCAAVRRGVRNTTGDVSVRPYPAPNAQSQWKFEEGGREGGTLEDGDVYTLFTHFLAERARKGRTERRRAAAHRRQRAQIMLRRLYSPIQPPHTTKYQ